MSFNLSLKLSLKMSNDDSFNDSDEIFSLYSSKKVTDTFKAQLKKIAANNYHFNKTLHVNNESILCREEKYTNHERPPNIQEEKVVDKEVIDQPIDSIVIIDDEQQNTLVEVNDNSLEDCIEVITVLPSRTTRQSERLRKKRSVLSSSRSTKEVHKPTQIWNNGSKPERQKEQKKPMNQITLDNSPQQTETDEELNPELSVKVIWKSVNVKKFKVRKFQKLSYIFEQLSKEENITEDKIMLTFNNIRVSRNDTPDSLNLQVYHFLDGGVLGGLSNVSDTLNSQNSECNSDCVVIKFQDANKKIIKLNLHKNEKLKVGMIKCSEQLEIPLNRIRFFFDGELVEPCSTPASLGLENEEVIDIKMYG